MAVEESTSRRIGTIFLLEDNPARLQRMLAVLASLLPTHAVHVEDDAAAANAWLAEHLQDLVLISLDHDLDSVPRNEEAPRDHGCGRDVANFLATHPPTCPVIIHTTNHPAGVGMIMELKAAKWPVFRVYPHDDEEWVDTDWRQTLQEMVAAGWLHL